MIFVTKEIFVTEKGSVKNHMLVHTGIKDFQCEVCEKKFYKKSSLKQHMLTHTKVKDYECDICKKKFSQKNHLVQHFRIHSGEKPYGCAEYGKWYTQSSGRKKLYVLNITILVKSYNQN